MISLFDRYFYKELSKIFFSTLFGVFFLFILIDYSTHMKIFLSKELSFSMAAFYFASQLSQLADILFPLALTISVIKVLSTAMARNEITALLSSGISYRRLLRPFFAAGILVSAFLFINFEWLYPPACQFHSRFTDQFFHKNAKQPAEVNSLFLKDKSLLIYKQFDPQKKIFTELFWIKSFDELYRMEKLTIEKTAFGENVDHFLRNSSGALTKKESSSSLSFNEIHFEKKLLTMATSPSLLSMSNLFSLLSSPFGFIRGNHFQAHVASFFYYRLSSLFLPLLSVIAIAPFCLLFSRIKRTFLLFALSLTLLFAFFTLTRSLLILAQAQVIPPFWSILLPYFLAFGIFGRRYASL